jgi:hypothetical protein
MRAGKEPNSKVQPAVENTALPLQRRLGHEFDAHAVLARVEAPERSAQGRVGVGHGAVDDADAEVARQPAADRTGIGGELLDRREQALCLAEDDGALVGESEAGAAAAAEPDPQAPLERRDVAADRGQAEVQRRLRPREALGVRDRREDPQQPEIGVGYLGARATSTGQSGLFRIFP